MLGTGRVSLTVCAAWSAWGDLHIRLTCATSASASIRTIRHSAATPATMASLMITAEKRMLHKCSRSGQCKSPRIEAYLLYLSRLPLYIHLTPRRISETTVCEFDRRARYGGTNVE